MTGTLFGHARGHWRAQLRFDAPTQGSELHRIAGKGRENLPMPLSCSSSQPLSIARSRPALYSAGVAFSLFQIVARGRNSTSDNHCAINSADKQTWR